MAFIILFLILGLLFVFFIMFIETMKKQQEEEYRELVYKVKNCPPHNWSYHPRTSKMTCIKCNFEAGDMNEQSE